ncbi:protein prenyltransferase alpha subunit repeat-containing protein 1 [Myotis lucifugus]|uniref:protein prenyltransferase alpha subunit repeat-containing protein 1 n=1 Tax=Myotis lucifugus TaxID=59463 RepID=UPI000CCC4DA4|nr:protein prenyltransferase alpha subunit repeat-containing protein 1 [Myotis lucifugus]
MTRKNKMFNTEPTILGLITQYPRQQPNFFFPHLLYPKLAESVAVTPKSTGKRVCFALRLPRPRSFPRSSGTWKDVSGRPPPRSDREGDPGAHTLDEIGLIPCPEARYNRSPIVLVENKLGVESWCVKFLLPYVHNKLILYRTRKQWLNKDELIDVTRTLLLLNPDFTTAWNVRKELILSGTLNPIKDLHLGKLALTKFPKSPETWIHSGNCDSRLQRYMITMQETSLPSFVTKGNLGTIPAERTQRLIREEMEVCGEAAGRYPSNYNAWSHRIWVLQHLAKLDVKILLDELSSTKHWASMHVSDHSGFHYRQFLLKSLTSQTVKDSSVLEQNPLRSEPALLLPQDEAAAASTEEPRINIPHLLEEEVEFTTDLIDSYPGHETLWCHRRHVFYLQHHLRGSFPHSVTQLSTADSPVGTSSDLHHIPTGPRTAQAMEVDGLSDSSKQGYSQETKRLKRTPALDSVGLEMEHRFIDQVLSTCRNVEQARFANAYRKWLGTLSQ